VSEIDVREGEYTKSEDSITPVARVIDVSSLIAEVEVDELDVPRIQVGQQATFYFDALPGIEVEGRIFSLPYEGRITTEGIAVLDAELIIDDPTPEIIPGYSFNAQIMVSDEETALVLDENALIERNGETMVLVPSRDGGEPLPMPVKTTPFDDGRVKVLSGLSEGDTVLAFNEMSSEATQSKPGEQEENGTSVIDMLGLPTKPGPGGGGGGPQGGGK
jgi:HlyD family secretion protein